jgi:hypothetical protein
MRSNFSKANIFRVKLGAMWFIECSWISSRGAGSISLRNACVQISMHLMSYLTRAQYNCHHHENLKSTCSWSAGLVMCRRTTDRWKYPLLFCSLLRMQFWRSHVWRATFPLGIPHSFKWTHCSRLSQLFYCYINVNLKFLDLLSLCYILPLFICIYIVSYVPLVKVELKFSYARPEEVYG